RLGGVARTGGARPVAGLGRVAVVARRPTHGAGVAPVVGRAGGAGPVAGLGHVAHAHGRATHAARVARRVLAGDVGAVALIEGARVAVGGAGRAAALLAVGGTARGATRAALGQVALVRRRATHRTARHEATRGRAARARRPVRRPLIAVLARVHGAVAAARIRLVGRNVRRPALARDRRPGFVGVGRGDDLVLRVDVEGVPAAVHPCEGRVAAPMAVVAGREAVGVRAGDADGAEEELGRLRGGGGETGVRRGAATVAGIGLIQRARLGQARELVGGEHSSGGGRRERDRDGVSGGQGVHVVGGEDHGAYRARP